MTPTASAKAACPRRGAAAARPGPVLLGRRRIERRVNELARRIDELYDGQEITIVAVLTGSMVFLADLIRRLKLPLRLEVAQLRSYPGRSTRPRPLRFTLPLTAPLKGRHVLIVDDILDSGLTLERLAARVAAQRPASLRTCVLLAKDRPDRPGRLRPDLVGFNSLPEDFVVGYGLDYDNLYRNLPDVRRLTRGRRRPVRAGSHA